MHVTLINQTSYKCIYLNANIVSSKKRKSAHKCYFIGGGGRGEMGNMVIGVGTERLWASDEIILLCTC